jgi:hypothetical protein
VKASKHKENEQEEDTHCCFSIKYKILDDSALAQSIIRVLKKEKCDVINNCLYSHHSVRKAVTVSPRSFSYLLNSVVFQAPQFTMKPTTSTLLALLLLHGSFATEGGAVPLPI